MDDWRLFNQEEYLKGKDLVFKKYTKYRNDWDHDHCEFCKETFSEWEGDLMLILLPIALVFSDSSMSNLQSVSIIAAFPIGAVIVLITLSFLKDAKKYMDEH